MKELILGSNSPRRKEILGYFSLPFATAASNFDEESISFDSGSPADYAASLAVAKGKALLPLYPLSPILTADTIVFYEGKIYGKPSDREQALAFLSALAGNEHSVFTAVCLHYESSFKMMLVEETKVIFNPLSPCQCESYLNAVAWQDKAGGYAIQNNGSLLVKKIEGCYYNVMGLPINAVAQLLQTIGIDLWHYLS